MSRGNICGFAILLLPLAGAASAGPWARAEDRVFLSFSGERGREGGSHASLYAEYGLKPRTTLGLKLDRSGAGERGALVWLQRSLGPDSGANRWTVSLGVGAIERDGTLLPQGQLGAAWGRGFEGFLGGGWLSVETRVNVAGAPREAGLDEGAPVGAGYLAQLTPELGVKGEVMLGLHLTSEMMFINELRLEQRQDAGSSTKLATSVVRDLAGPAKLELGLVTPLSGPGEKVLKFGTWLEF